MNHSVIRSYLKYDSIIIISYILTLCQQSFIINWFIRHCTKVYLEVYLLGWYWVHLICCVSDWIIKRIYISVPSVPINYIFIWEKETFYIYTSLVFYGYNGYTSIFLLWINDLQTIYKQRGGTPHYPAGTLIDPHGHKSWIKVKIWYFIGASILKLR